MGKVAKADRRVQLGLFRWEQTRPSRSGRGRRRADTPLFLRFWECVDRRGPDECWLWKRGRDRDGYGDIRVNNRHQRANRVAYELTKGALPDGLQALHACDNPPCCNPAHLFPGTNADNTADRQAKGRQAKGDRAGRRTRPESYARLRGSQVGNAKLCDFTVRLIASSAMSERELGELFGVTQQNISAIRRGKTWRHALEQ